ncbi:MAG: CopG family transcriptional regulator [Deltaproteobacteria bacterium]|nr:CopG family transcriptional regulator [Deltaproteobacteria bacterium]
MRTVQAELPEQLYAQASRLVQSGWFRDESEIVYEAMRRFLESHEDLLMEQFVREDVEWGLHGDD